MTTTVPILMYHSVAEDPRAATRRLSVTPAALQRQMTVLRDRGFVGMTFGDFAEACQSGGGLPAKPVVLTFDDGYADFAETAWPILAENGFPATVFVTTGWIDDAGPYAAGPAPDRMLSWSQVRRLAAEGVEIGAHSHSHPELDQLDGTALAEELRVGRALLEDCIGARIRSLAYPFGYSDPGVAIAARHAGYRCAAAVRNIRARTTDDLFRLPRLTIRRATHPARFTAAVEGPHAQMFWRERVLTAGWTPVRRTRRLVKRVTADV
jgi:peptidoglycan/xylan/chitin deacetylase (PgdA/CDA1 family)